LVESGARQIHVDRGGAGLTLQAVRVLHLGINDKHLSVVYNPQALEGRSESIETLVSEAEYLESVSSLKRRDQRARNTLDHMFSFIYSVFVFSN
jgi:hypothetical protein